MITQVWPIWKPALMFFVSVFMPLNCNQGSGDTQELSPKLLFCNFGWQLGKLGMHLFPAWHTAAKYLYLYLYISASAFYFQIWYINLFTYLHSEICLINICKIKAGITPPPPLHCMFTVKKHENIYRDHNNQLSNCWTWVIF